MGRWNLSIRWMKRGFIWVGLMGLMWVKMGRSLLVLGKMGGLIGWVLLEGGWVLGRCLIVMGWFRMARWSGRLRWSLWVVDWGLVCNGGINDAPVDLFRSLKLIGNGILAALLFISCMFWYMSFLIECSWIYVHDVSFVVYFCICLIGFDRPLTRGIFDNKVLKWTEVDVKWRCLLFIAKLQWRLSYRL